jgi:hypothetical protein
MFSIIVSLLCGVIYLVRVTSGRLTLDDLELKLLLDMDGDITLRDAQWTIWWSPRSQRLLAECQDDQLREQRLARLRGE